MRCNYISYRICFYLFATLTIQPLCPVYGHCDYRTIPVRGLKLVNMAKIWYDQRPYTHNMCMALVVYGTVDIPHTSVCKCCSQVLGSCGGTVVNSVLTMSWLDFSHDYCASHCVLWHNIYRQLANFKRTLVRLYQTLLNFSFLQNMTCVGINAWMNRYSLRA